MVPTGHVFGLCPLPSLQSHLLGESPHSIIVRMKDGGDLASLPFFFFLIRALIL